MDTMLQAALSYLDNGLSPLALCPPSCDCGAPGKVPHTKNWQAACAELPDEESVIADFARLGGNVGIAAGLASGIIIVDCDSEAALQYFMINYAIPPNAPVVRSGRVEGGGHVYFDWDPSIDTCDIEINGHAYEIKSSGSQCVAPPSIHKSGNTYQWVVPFERDNLIPIPPEFLEDAKAPAKKIKTAKNEALAARKNRNTPTELFNDTADYRALLENHGWRATGDTSEDPQHGTLEYYTRPGKEAGISAVWHVDGRFLYVFTSNAPHLSKDRYYFLFDLFATYEHGGDRTKAAKALNPTPPPPPQEPPEYSVDYLGNDETESSDDSHIITTPTVTNETEFNAAAIIPPGTWLAEYMRYLEPRIDAPAQFGIACGMASLAMACRSMYFHYGLSTIRPNLWIAIVAPSTRYRKSTSLSIAQKIIEKMEDGLIFPSTYSPEGFISHLADDSAAGVFVWPELNATLGNLQKSYMSGHQADLTQLYDCPDIWPRKTVAKGLVKVEKPFVNILTASTQEWLNQRITEGDLRGGFLPRFLWIMAYSKDKFYPWPTPGHPDLEDRLAARLYQISEAFRGGMTIHPVAKEMYCDYSTRLDTESAADPETEGALAACFARLSIYTLKFAMIYQADIQTAKGEAYDRIITPLAMEYAISWCEYLKGGITRMLSDIAFDEQMQARNKALKIIKEKPGIPRRDVMRALHLKKKDFDEVMLTLIEMEKVKMKSVKVNGQEKLVYYPLVDE